MVQQVRAHRPSELLPALAREGAGLFDGGPLRVDPAGLHPWVLAGLARESLAYGNEHRAAPVTAATVASLHNTYTALTDPFLRPDDGVGPWDLLLRTAYEQLGWQGSVFGSLARFGAMFDRDFGAGYAVLGRGPLRELLGADPGEYFGVAMLLTVSAQVNVGWFDPGWLDQPQFADVLRELSRETVLDVFHGAYAEAFATVAARARADRNPEKELRKHDLNPLVATPYVRMPDGRYLAPAPTLVPDRASLAAVYFAGRDRWGDAFTVDLGRLVEAYAGEQLALVPGATLTPERTYGRGGGSLTVDWVMVLPDAVLLVEVKSARVAQPGRLDAAGFHDDVKRDVGKGFRQVAATAALLRDGHPVMGGVPTDLPVRGLIVTAEPHYLINNPVYRRGLPDPTVPTVVLSLEELENGVSLSLRRPPGGVFLGLTDWEATEGVAVGAVLRREYEASGLERWDNPILDEAWARYPFGDDDPPLDGSPAEPDVSLGLG